MSFRLRLTMAAALAVAVAVVAVALLASVLLEQRLRAQVDATLREAATIARAAPGPQMGQDFRPGFGMRLLLVHTPLDRVFAQVVDRNGNVRGSNGEPAPDLVTLDTRAIAALGTGERLEEVRLEGARLRVLTVPLTRGFALQLAVSLAEMEAALAQARLLLGLLGAGGVALAAGLGLIVSRAALGPVGRLTETIEEVTRTRDLSRRVAVGGRDELGRLAAGFDAMLGALETSLRSQRQLVTDASHELRTPLTSLRTNLELLARGQPTDEGERRLVMRDLVEQVERLSRLVGDLIDLARDETVALPVEDLRLDEAVEEALADVRVRYPRVRFELQGQRTIVRGVRSRIARAVTNLLDNAGKWSPPDGIVQVRVADGEISVRDHGPGVSEEDAPRVFDRFWRASDARHLPGSGLGLAIVKDVADSHGGAVWLERPADGSGALFHLRLHPAV